jgi:hypothetical protein
MIDNAPEAKGTPNEPDCEELPKAPTVPEIPASGTCPGRCDCPDPPGGEPPSCFDRLIQRQNIIVKTADRARIFAGELSEIQDKVESAKADYTPARFIELRKRWKEQDDAIAELIRKLVCAVGCWDCLLECRLCKQLVEIRKLEDRLDGAPSEEVGGTGKLTGDVYSLYDQQAWHVRNVAQMEARMKRIKEVLAAWENPSTTLGEALDKNADLIKETQNLIASDPAKAVYDVFMTLIPRHWAIRPRGPGLLAEWTSDIDEKYVRICDCPKPPAAATQQGNADESANRGQPGRSCDGDDDGGKCRCDDGVPDDCCGPDVGILSLRERMVGPLPYIVDAGRLSAVICCLTTNRLAPASEQLAAAQAELASSSAEIELVQKQITDKKAAIEATFRAALDNPIDCEQFPKTRTPTPGGNPPGGSKHPGQTLS